jgi:hypothetical protein
MDTNTLRDWAAVNGTELENGADRTLGLTSKLIRFRRNGVPTVAVGSDADAKTRIDAVLDGIAWTIARHGGQGHLDLLVGIPDLDSQSSSQREEIGAIGTLITSLLNGPKIRLLSIEDDGTVGLLETARRRQVDGLAAELLDAIDHPSIALYPKLSSQKSDQPWQIRIDGLDIGRVGTTVGTLRLATRKLEAKGRPRDQWRKIVGDPSRPFNASSLDGIVITINELIDEFSQGSSGVLDHGQPEHGLEAHVLSGRLRLTTSTGQPLHLAVSATDGVLRAAQFPTLWGDVTSPARYLDTLLADDKGRPWAIELKDQFAGGGHGAYLRAGTGQAVLYRHYIRSVTATANWFQHHALDHTQCQAALAFPTAKPGANTIVQQHIELAARFGIDIVQFTRP